MSERMVIQIKNNEKILGAVYEKFGSCGTLTVEEMNIISVFIQDDNYKKLKESMDLPFEEFNKVMFDIYKNIQCDADIERNTLELDKINEVSGWVGNVGYIDIKNDKIQLGTIYQEIDYFFDHSDSSLKYYDKDSIIDANDNLQYIEYINFKPDRPLTFKEFDEIMTDHIDNDFNIFVHESYTFSKNGTNIEQCIFRTC